MPELPEVECIARGLGAIGTGMIVTRAEFLRRDLREPIPIAEFQRIVVGQALSRVWRRSKFILWETQLGYGIFHLGMTGNILKSASPLPEHKHTHAIFTLQGPGRTSHLHFVDPRRFGWITCAKLGELEEHRLFCRLGPEPLESPNLGQHLFTVSRGCSIAIKALIMDAHRVVGVGNIYASEALFRARIHPSTPAGQLKRVDYDTLAQAIQDTLNQAIAEGGTTFRDFRHTDGKPGYFERLLLVYGRNDEPCRKCRTSIQQMRHGGRSSYFCPSCQKLKIARLLKRSRA